MALDTESKLRSLRVPELNQVLRELGKPKLGKKADKVFVIINELKERIPETTQAIDRAYDTMRAPQQQTPYHPPNAVAQRPNIIFHRPPIFVQNPNQFIAGVALPNPIAANPNLPKLPAAVIPMKPIVFQPTLTYKDARVIHTVRVGFNGQKPPIGLNVNLKPEESLLLENPQFKLVIVCARSIPSSIHNPLPSAIEYPQGCVLLFNGQQSQFNLTKQYHDLTKAYRPNLKNSLMIQFYSSPILTVQEIVKSLEGSRMSKEVIIASRKEEAIKDDDIQTGDEVVQLLDPFSRCRINYPVRSKKCSHVQCFDLETYIEVQKTAKKQECPVCYTGIREADLVLDGYFEDILQNTDTEVESVTVSQTGEWSLLKDESSFTPQSSFESNEKKLDGESNVINFLESSPAKAKDVPPTIFIID